MNKYFITFMENLCIADRYMDYSKQKLNVFVFIMTVNYCELCMTPIYPCRVSSVHARFFKKLPPEYHITNISEKM